MIIPKEYSFEPNKIKEYDLKIKNKNENVENNDKDEKEDINILIKNILNNDILNETKKEDLNKLILKIKSTDINKIINNNNKLDIVFDLSNTCVFDYIINEEEYKKLLNQNLDKDMHFIIFNHNNKIIHDCVILRKGLYDFFQFSKSFCNFHINYLGIEIYLKEIMQILENSMKIKFLKYKERNDKDARYIKYLKDLNLDKNDTVIFDDNPCLWKEDHFNVIISKKFISKIFKEKENNLEYFLFNNFPFCYYKSNIDSNGQINWNKQKLYGERPPPFYYFNENNESKDNDCYSSEYLDSSKYQFNYMKNIVKIIYYFVFTYNTSVPDILKLIRYNIFYKTYFNLSFYKGEKEILKHIIRNCGGKIYDDKINNKFKDEKLFFVCRKEDYSFFKDKIKNEMLAYRISKVVNGKFILDSFYFMTSIENELIDQEYSFEN